MCRAVHGMPLEKDVGPVDIRVGDACLSIVYVGLSRFSISWELYTNCSTSTV